MLWAAIIVTVLAVIFTAIVWVGNRGSFHNYIEPRADWLLVGVWLLVAFLWIIYGLSSPAHAAARAFGETTVAPGMVALALVRLPRDPDVRCVIRNCFPPPARRRGESQRRFEHRLLSPAGRSRLE